MTRAPRSSLLRFVLPLRSPVCMAFALLASTARAEIQPNAPAPNTAPPTYPPPPYAPAPYGSPPPYAPPPYAQPAPFVPPPPSSGPQRQGFTLELGLGAGFTVISAYVNSATICRAGTGCVSASSTSETESHFGLAPLSFGLGGFLSPQVALLFRATGTSFFLDNDQWVNALYGVGVQYWPSDIVYVGAGAGFATIGNGFLGSNHSSDSITGFGFSARVGIAVASFTHHSLRFAYEALPCFYDKGRVIGNALTFEWQYF